MIALAGSFPRTPHVNSSCLSAHIAPLPVQKKEGCDCACPAGCRLIGDSERMGRRSRLHSTTARSGSQCRLFLHGLGRYVCREALRVRGNEADQRKQRNQKTKNTHNPTTKHQNKPKPTTKNKAHVCSRRKKAKGADPKTKHRVKEWITLPASSLSSAIASISCLAWEKRVIAKAFTLSLMKGGIVISFVGTGRTKHRW